MGKPAARVGDMHICPMVTPGVPPIPHVGGPILPPGKPTVLIGGVPAATMGSMCTCVGPPDSIILGSLGVMIGGQPAARMGDMCAHGGSIAVGLPTVLIGDIQAGALSEAAAGAASPQSGVNGLAVKILMENIPEAFAAPFKLTLALIEAAKDGIPLVHNSLTCSVCNRKS